MNLEDIIIIITNRVLKNIFKFNTKEVLVLNSATMVPQSFKKEINEQNNYYNVDA